MAPNQEPEILSTNENKQLRIHKVGIIMNGVSERVDTNQHLIRSIMAIIAQGGLRINEQEIIVPVPILFGRNKEKLEKLDVDVSVKQCTTDFDETLAHTRNIIYFDAQITNLRFSAVKKVIVADKHIYCEKPVA